MKKIIVIAGIVIALLVVVGGLVFFGVIPSPDASVGVEESRTTRDPSTAPTDDIGSSLDDTGLTQVSCSAASGTWNSCGSACRTDPDAICIELCVEYCECQSDVECPSGYTCGDVVDGVGVCL